MVFQTAQGTPEGEEALRKELEEARALAREYQGISEIGRIISSSIHIEEVYGQFSQEVQKLIPFDRIVINTIDIEKETVINVYMAGVGISGRKVGEVYTLRGSGNAEMVRTQSVFLLQTEDIHEVSERYPMLVSTFQTGFRSIMNVPLFLRGRIVGGLLLRSLKPFAYTEAHLALAQKVGHQIAGPIANTRLYMELQHTQEEREKLIQNLQEALLKVKTLNGLLPICASCKKIRDDKGYWTQIEAYIRDHSDADFSHAICPECMEKLYPDFVESCDSDSTPLPESSR
ncbi:MAG: GAF domain-containing protein [Thermodesulfobacteriota bacterium]